MNRAQYFDLAWIYFAIVSAVLLQISRVVTQSLKQPADRIRIIYFTLLGLAVTPVLLVLAPWSLWQLPLMRNAEEPATTSYSTTAPHSAETQHDFTEHEVAAVPGLNVQADAWSIESVRDSSSIGTPPSSDNPASKLSAESARNRASAWKWLAIIFLMFHAAAAIYTVVEWMLSSFWLRRLSRSAQRPSDQMLNLWDRVSSGRGRHIRILVSDSIDSPLIYGWLHPVVLLPKELLDASESTLTFCLAHEWCHIERGDLLGWHFVRLCQCLLGELPMYWSLRRELRLQQDMLADDRSTRAKRDAVEYSELLLGFARSRVTVPIVGALTFSDQPSQLSKRIKMLLENSTAIRFRSSCKFSLAVAVCTFLFAVVIGSVRLSVPLAAEESKKNDQTQASNPPAKETPGSSGIATPVTIQQENTDVTKTLPAVTPSADGSLKYTCSVIDMQTGKGIPNARIKVRRTIYSQGDKLIEETKHVTDTDGKYSVIISAEHAAIEGLEIILNVDHDDYVGKKDMGYEFSRIRKNELMGERPFFEKTELCPAELVTGTIVSPDGQPVAGVEVKAYSMAKDGDSNTGSINQTVTETDGRFRLKVHEAANVIIWSLPKDYAAFEKFLAKTRGDLGTMKLTDGIRVSGQVKSAEGKLLSGVTVDINDVSERDFGGLQSAVNIRRKAVTNESGQFVFDPLLPGNYTMTPSVHQSLPGNFAVQKLVLKENTSKQEVIIQAVPHVIMSGQIFNSKGEKHNLDHYPVTVRGELDGERWFTMREPDQNGTFEVKIPHGIQQAVVQFYCNETHSLRYRMGPGQPLKNLKTNNKFDLGTLNDDIPQFELIYYEAPIVLVTILDEANKQIKDARVSAAYPWGKDGYVLDGEVRSDLRFELQTDGRHRTMQMLPNEEMTFKATAVGYDVASEKVKLAEGEKKELILTLKKSAASSTEK